MVFLSFVVTTFVITTKECFIGQYQSDTPLINIIDIHLSAMTNVSRFSGTFVEVQPKIYTPEIDVNAHLHL